ncbi:hypothetical protein HKX48_009471 [Thoreauomyces humboldtii]|nr:hypothetical protein HKX48_009471 [Thoreauomyces humboldtii]
MSKTVDAALVHRFGDAPVYGTYELPPPKEGQVQVKVIASGLSQLAKARANGTHYSCGRMTLPVVPGVDGVGTLPDGKTVFFTAFKSKAGPFAEYVNVSLEDTVELPANADPIHVAALANAGMASWLALSRRRNHAVPPNAKPFNVFILGVTGMSGRLGVQVARLLGASRIVGAGRNKAVLDELLKVGPGNGGVDDIVCLGDGDDKVKEAVTRLAADTDVILDFLWGAPAKVCMEAILKARKTDEKLLEWVQIGAMAGAELALPAPWLRAQNFFICGSGLGPQSNEVMHKHLSDLIVHLAEKSLSLPVNAVPLKDCEAGWNADKGDGRLVFVL